MIIKFLKNLNENNEYTLISFSMDDNLDGISLNVFDENECNVYCADEFYYYYLKNVISLNDDYEKFKVKVRKGDVVSITSTDNSYIVYPSKKAFAYVFGLNYNKVLNYEYTEVLYDGKPYEVKYVKGKEGKTDDGVVYTLSQLITYVSTLIKGHNYRSVDHERKSKSESEILHRVLNKHYSKDRSPFNRKYELNYKRVGKDCNGKWHSKTIYNISKSNKYLHDLFLLKMFAGMIVAKSLNDRNNSNDPMYCFNDTFDSLDDVYKFLENNQDIVNNFFIETETIFNKPNDMYTAYAPHINGVYMFYEYNGSKVYLWRSIDNAYFSEHSLKGTYVSTKYKHKIKGIKVNYTF